MSFRLTVKDGDTKYSYNQKTGTYDSKTSDYVEEFESFESALSEFLYYISEDSGQEHKTSLTFIPKKRKK